MFDPSFGGNTSTSCLHSRFFLQFNIIINLKINYDVKLQMTNI